MKRHDRSADGKYHISGKVYDMNEGSRAQVMHGTAHKTSGGLVKDKLMMNKHGRVVSRKKHATAKKEKRLEAHGYFAKKGKFGAVRKDGSKSKGSKSKGSKSKRSKSKRNQSKRNH